MARWVRSDFWGLPVPRELRVSRNVHIRDERKSVGTVEMQVLFIFNTSDSELQCSYLTLYIFDFEAYPRKSDLNPLQPRRPLHPMLPPASGEEGRRWGGVEECPTITLVVFECNNKNS